MFFIIGSTVKGTGTIWSRPCQNYFGSKLAVPIWWQLFVWIPLKWSDVSSSQDSESFVRLWVSKHRLFHLCIFFRVPLPSRKLPRHIRFIGQVRSLHRRSSVYISLCGGLCGYISLSCQRLEREWVSMGEINWNWTTAEYLQRANRMHNYHNEILPQQWTIYSYTITSTQVAADRGALRILRQVSLPEGGQKFWLQWQLADTTWLACARVAVTRSAAERPSNPPTQSHSLQRSHPRLNSIFASKLHARAPLHWVIYIRLIRWHGAYLQTVVIVMEILLPDPEKLPSSLWSRN